MKVYRVELPCGAGPYRLQCPDSWYRGCPHRAPAVEDVSLDIHERHGVWGDMSHPAPVEEGLPLLSEDPSLWCAFPSVEVARDWFDGCLPALAEVGFELVEYVVPKRDVECGERQVIFKRSSARPASRFPLLECDR